MVGQHQLRLPYFGETYVYFLADPSTLKIAKLLLIKINYNRTFHFCLNCSSGLFLATQYSFC